MKTHPIEDRLRDALAAHAETFSAGPDAWQHIQRKSEVPARPRRIAGSGWLARHSAFVVPAAAAATVAALALGAVAVAHGIPDAGRGGTPPKTATHGPAAHGRPSGGPAGQMLATDPAISAIFSLDVARNVRSWNWIGQPSPLYWFPYVATRPEACHWITDTNGGGSGSCWPMPAVNATHPAVVISSSDYVGAGNPIISGLAGPSVTAVSAVLRDGQRCHAAIGTAKGFGGVKAWSVDCPAEKGMKLIFTGSAGQIVSELSTAAPAGPIVLDVPQPAKGGVRTFSYPASRGVKSGAVTAYLIDDHVAFFSPALPAGSFSPDDATARPAAAGMAYPFGVACTPDCRNTNIRAFGYAHGDVAKVVVRLPGGREVTAHTFRAGWAGSDLRLWQVTLPDNAWPANGSEPDLIATAYDASGDPMGQARLGQPQM